MRFNHVTLVVRELERSKAFYRALALVPIVDAPPRYARFAFTDGDATLSLEVTSEGPTHPPSVQLFLRVRGTGRRGYLPQGQGHRDRGASLGSRRTDHV